MSKPVNCFMVALEPSGDLLGADLLQRIRPYSDLQVEGVVGPALEKEGAKLFRPLPSVMGFFSVLKKIPFFLELKKEIVNHILDHSFDIVVTIDSSTFNFSLAKELRKKGFQGRLIHCVCPTIWAYRKSRKKTLLETYDSLLYLFDFEDDLFNGTSLKRARIGHRLVSSSPNTLNQPRSLISIFPGSRPSLIRKMLPLQYQAACLLKEDIGISVSDPSFLPWIEPLAPKARFFLNAEELMRETKVAIATSGTITLELALMEIPTVVTYSLSWIDLLLAKYLLKIHLPFYALPNLLLQQSLFPECFGWRLQPHTILLALQTLLASPPQFNSKRLKETISPTISDETLARSFFQ